MPDNIDKTNSELITYRLGELTSLVRLEFDKLNSRIDNTERRLLNVELQQAKSSEREKIRIETLDKDEADSKDWVKVTLGLIAVLTTAIGIIAALIGAH